MPDSPFDKLARQYTQLERFAFGEGLQHARTAYLDYLIGRRHLLCLGEGTGRYLTAASERFPNLRITVVESSAQMIEHAKAALISKSLAAEHVRWLQADILTWEPEETITVDAVATHFFLDCFLPHEVDAIINRVSTIMNPGALWFLSDFASNNRLDAAGLPLRLLHQATVKTLYLFFQSFARISGESIYDPLPPLQASGFTLLDKKSFMQHLVWSGVLEKESDS